MALVKSFTELKRRQAKEPAADVTMAAVRAIAEIVRKLVPGTESLPPKTDRLILDAIAKAGVGTFYLAYERAMAAGVRVAIDMIAEHESEQTRTEVMQRLGRAAKGKRRGTPSQARPNRRSTSHFRGDVDSGGVDDQHGNVHGADPANGYAVSCPPGVVN